VNGESGDGSIKDWLLSVDCAEMPKPAYAEFSSLWVRGIESARTLSFDWEVYGFCEGAEYEVEREMCVRCTGEGCGS
jgi:hypothetical protein